MDRIAFRYDRSFVLKALSRLAERYPTPREKEEVPVWLYLASELSLKLHGSESYRAFPRVLRSGGLIDALGPELGGRKTSHPQTRDVTLSCPGFNRKNDYDRQTPCDQDPRRIRPRHRGGPAACLVQPGSAALLALAAALR